MKKVIFLLLICTSVYSQSLTYFYSSKNPAENTYRYIIKNAAPPNDTIYCVTTVFGFRFPEFDRYVYVGCGVWNYNLSVAPNYEMYFVHFQRSANFKYAVKKNAKVRK